MTDDSLLASVFEAMPAMSFVVDDDVRVMLANEAGRELAKASPEEIARWQKPGGELLRCVHARDAPEGCGRGPACASCGIRGTVAEAIETGKVARRTHFFEPEGAPEGGGLPLRVAASPLAVLGARMAVLTLEVAAEEPAKP